MNFEEQPSFNPDVVSRLFKLAWKHENTKVNRDALSLSCEFFRLFTVEAIHRAAEEQDVLSNSSTKILETEHLERILPQLLLDF